MKRNKEFQKAHDEEMSPKKRAKNNENDKPRVISRGLATCYLSPKRNAQHSNSMCEAGNKKSAFAR